MARMEPRYTIVPLNDPLTLALHLQNDLPRVLRFMARTCAACWQSVGATVCVVHHGADAQSVYHLRCFTNAVN